MTASMAVRGVASPIALDATYVHPLHLKPLPSAKLPASVNRRGSPAPLPLFVVASDASKSGNLVWVSGFRGSETCLRNPTPAEGAIKRGPVSEILNPETQTR